MSTSNYSPLAAGMEEIPDLELGIRCSCPARVKKEGAGTVPARNDIPTQRAAPILQSAEQSLADGIAQLRRFNDLLEKGFTVQWGDTTVSITRKYDPKPQYAGRGGV